MAISGIVLYPAVHESGHMLAGVLLGGEADLEGAAWTALSAEGPHSAFHSLPQHALPWMSAGGTVLPVLVGLLLLLAHRIVWRRAPWPVSAALMTISTLFLLSAVGSLFELHRETHMDLLSVHLGLTGPARVLFSLSPFLVAGAAGLRIGPTLRRLVESLRKQPEGESPG